MEKITTFFTFINKVRWSVSFYFWSEWMKKRAPAPFFSLVNQKSQWLERKLNDRKLILANRKKLLLIIFNTINRKKINFFQKKNSNTPPGKHLVICTHTHTHIGHVDRFKSIDLNVWSSVNTYYNLCVYFLSWAHKRKKTKSSSGQKKMEIE